MKFSIQIAPKSRIIPKAFGTEATVVQPMHIAVQQEQLVPIISGGCIRLSDSFFVSFLEILISIFQKAKKNN